MYMCVLAAKLCVVGAGKGEEEEPSVKGTGDLGEGSGARGLFYGGEPMFQHQPVEGDQRRWDHVDLSTALLRL